MRRDWNVDVVQVYRGANSCIDCLAKHGHNCPVGVHIFRSFPAFLILALLADLSRHCSPGFVAV